MELSRNSLEVSRQKTSYVIDLTSDVADAPDADFPIDWRLSERGRVVVDQAVAAKVAVMLR